MRILITNDDGINAPALPKLIKWAQKLGEVTCIAPKFEQSGKSQAIDFIKPVEIKRVDLVDGAEVYAMDSTPADCVRFGLVALGKKFDLVLSGVNKGYNLGHDIVYSGTVGAIFEAARLNVRGIAFSARRKYVDDAILCLDKAYEFIMSNNLFDYNGIYNVNFPPKEKGICITRQGGMFFADGYTETEPDTYIQTGTPVNYTDLDREIDIHAVLDGYISVTPLTHERTAYEAYNKLKSIK